MRARWELLGQAGLAEIGITFDGPTPEAPTKGSRMWLATLVHFGCLVCIAIATASCGTQKADKSSTSTQSVTSGSGTDVIPTSTARKGALPASAAGTSGPSGPGVPADFAGVIETSTPLSAEEQAATDAANLLYKARNPAPQSPVDRGFAAQPSATADAGTTP